MKPAAIHRDVKPDNVSEREVLTLTELCARWKTSRKSLLAKIHTGELHAFRIGERAYRVSMVEVLRHERGD